MPDLSPDDKSPGLHRAVYFRSPKESFDPGVKPITEIEYSATDELLQKELADHRLGYGSRESYRSTTTFYLVMGGIVEIGQPIGHAQIRLTHESSDGLERMIEHLKLPK